VTAVFKIRNNSRFSRNF